MPIGGKMAFTKLLGLLLIISIFSGCIIRGPKTENKTPLSVLNGENYDNGPNPYGADRLILPVITTKERQTRIRGSVRTESGIAEIPLKNCLVELRLNEALVKKTTTDSFGDFTISGVIKNGSYTLHAISKSFEGEKRIEVSQYDVDNVVIKVAPKPN
jgi:hypothetical protein